jgi:EmrB/QacA subfamily drug resistance transporter
VLFPPEQRAMAIGIWSGTSALGVAIGPLVGGLITENLVWNWIFLINVPVGIAGLILSPRLIPESRDRSAGRSLDFPGVITSALALGAITFALIEAPSQGWTSTEILALFGLGAALFVAFIVIEHTGAAPLLDLSLFRNGAFSGANLVALVTGVTMFSVLVYMSVYLQRVLGYSAFKAGLTFLPMTMLIVVCSPISAKVSERAGPRWFLAGGLAIIGVGLVALSGLGTSSSQGDVIWRLVICGIGIGLVMAPMTDAALGSAPIQKSGVAAGVLNTCRQLGGAIGIAAIGAIIQSGQTSSLKSGANPGQAFVDGLHNALIVSAALTAAGAVAAAVLIRAVRLEPVPGADEPPGQLSPVA